MKTKYEKRIHPGVDFRFEESAEWPLSGHIAVFNLLSVDFGGWREKIAPGAFAESLKRDDIRALWNHVDDLVLGRLQSGTLELEEDNVGLAFRNKPPETDWFKDRAVSLRRKDVTGASFGFYTDEDFWETNHQTGETTRTLKRVTLVEVSPGVTFPAYPQTEVGLRSFEAWKTGQEKLSAGQLAARSASFHSRERRLRLIELGL